MWRENHVQELAWSLFSFLRDQRPKIRRRCAFLTRLLFHPFPAEYRRVERSQRDPAIIGGIIRPLRRGGRSHRIASKVFARYLSAVISAASFANPQESGRLLASIAVVLDPRISPDDDLVLLNTNNYTPPLSAKVWFLPFLSPFLFLRYVMYNFAKRKNPVFSSTTTFLVVFLSFFIPSLCLLVIYVSLILMESFCYLM